MPPKSDDDTLKDTPATLSDADISSQRVSWRSLLTTLVGIGAGAAAGVVAGVGASQPAMAQCCEFKFDKILDKATPSPKKKGLRANQPPASRGIGNDTLQSGFGNDMSRRTRPKLRRR